MGHDGGICSKSRPLNGESALTLLLVVVLVVGHDD
jgi:hypothetical protein